MHFPECKPDIREIDFHGYVPAVAADEIKDDLSRLQPGQHSVVGAA
jgi:hypothetical protein